jgi:hypothetical protein
MQLISAGGSVNAGFSIVVTFSVMVLAGVGLMIAAMMNRRRFREMEHRERLAMIERGVLPSPESDPTGFESGARFSGTELDAGIRYRTAGVLMIGFGLGLLVLISAAADNPEVGVGVGGAFAVLGSASLLNYFLISRREEDRGARRWTPRPTPRSPEPPNSL